MIEVLSMKMSKFYEYSKVFDRRTDTNARVQYLAIVRWAGYGKAYDSLVDHLKQAFRTRFQSNLNNFFLRHASIPTNYEFTLGSQMLNALASHPCGPGSILSSDHMWAKLDVGSFSAPRGFPPDTPVWSDPGDKSGKVSDFKCFRSSGMRFWLLGECGEKVSELKLLFCTKVREF